MAGMLAALTSCLLLLAAPDAAQGTDSAPERDRGSTPRRAGQMSDTMFEVAMFRTMEAVRAGRVPDPKLRKRDGSAGSLLDALLPERVVERGRNLRAANWHFLGASLSFTQGPTMAAFNASFYRYGSILPLSWVDWRQTMYITPIQIQYNCQACWAIAVLDTIAMATAIATNSTATPLSTQQICDCAGKGCCDGGWPEDAFAFAASNQNVTTARAYQYWAQDNRTCAWTPSLPTPPQTTGWERVPSFSQLALMQAVTMQPVLVYISASSKDFQQYSSGPSGSSTFNIYNGNCSSEVNHAVVVVGYDANANYWILKNTWPADGWGDNGYMYISMADGTGTCGMLTVNPLYPLFFPGAPQQLTLDQTSPYPITLSTGKWWNWWKAAAALGNLCTGIINPCGAGICFTMGGLARCYCPPTYVEIIGVPTSKCIPVSPCTYGPTNPCGSGLCTDVGDGTYVCACNTGFILGSQVSGGPTCVPLNTNAAGTYLTVYGDDCGTIQAAFNLSAAAFAALNPFVNCSGYIVPGTVVVLNVSTSFACTSSYAVRSGDTCSTVAWAMANPQFYYQLLVYQSLTSMASLSSFAPAKAVPPASPDYTAPLLALNPTLDCSSLYQSQQICVNGTRASSLARNQVACAQTYTTWPRDTCAIIMAVFGLDSATLNSLNPGLNCNYKNGKLQVGIQICIAAAVTNSLPTNCTQVYRVKQGDSCAYIWNAANLSQSQFMAINPGLQCQAPYLYVGQAVCIYSPLVPALSDPNFLTYVAQPGDTWQFIQSLYSGKCQPWSVLIPRLLLYNNITANMSSWNWTDPTPGATVIIPCVTRIGASCGCAPSLPVCGADSVNYQSFCDAQCNFALPVTSGACATCQAACAGRYGQVPSPVSACAAGYVCPWPTWPPPSSYASQIFATHPLCSYRQNTCLNACTLYAANFGATTSSTCYNSCYACSRVPCGGPSEVVPSTSAVCPNCMSPQCTSTSRSSACSTVCSYWNSIWNPFQP